MIAYFSSKMAVDLSDGSIRQSEGQGRLEYDERGFDQKEALA